MNGRDMLLVLAHLFRKLGNKVTIDDAIHFLSFNCRYGYPTNVRRLLSAALENEMISRDGEDIKAEFLFNKQYLPLNLSTALGNRVEFKDEVMPLH
jgi:hypothetical protein